MDLKTLHEYQSPFVVSAATPAALALLENYSRLSSGGGEHFVTGAVGVSSTSACSYLINQNFDNGSKYDNHLILSILQKASVTLKITVSKSELQPLAEDCKLTGKQQGVQLAISFIAQISLCWQLIWPFQGLWNCQWLL